MNRSMLLISIFCVVLFSSCSVWAQEALVPAEKVALFDGRSFEGWVRFLPNDADVDQTWQIKSGGVLACTGKPAGYIRTAQAYKNYKVHFEYRWPSQPGNNGILVHMQGEDKVWPKCLECQGQYHNQGDFWEIGGFEFNEHKVGGHRVRGRRVIKYGDHNEKELGEWNVYEVWCVGDTVRPYINGKLMNEASGCVVQDGKICLQSEGVPIEYRNITIEPATDLPWPVTPKKKIALFNGTNLDGWVRFIPDDKPNLLRQWTADTVWSVKEGVIRCEGKPNGYIRTVESYANYKLHLEWRWPEEPTNSGVLLHRTGMDATWPKCVEAQLQNQNAGDFWLLSFSTTQVDGKQVGPQQYANAKKKHPSNEKPAGQWNTYDILCKGREIILIVNGLEQNHGVDCDPWFGPICLQSEGSPIEFRNITLEPLPK